MAERISWFSVLDEADMTPEVRALHQKVRERTGVVPNVFKSYAWKPERFLKWFAHYRDVMAPSDGLSAADREMIGVVVSAQNRCLYCVTAHGASLRELTGDPFLAAQVQTDYRRADLDPRRRAMCDFAIKLTRTPYEVGREDVDALCRAGFSESDAWDIAEVTAEFNFSNRMASATGMMPNVEYYAK